MAKQQRFLEGGTVARELGVSAQWLNRLVNEGHIVPDAVTDQGSRLYEPASVERIRKGLSKRDK